MKLVSSNDPDFVKDTVQEAQSSYNKKSDVAAALGILTKLKGIGPATASLLLAVLDPDQVIFFADEAFYWLCCEGKKESIKYNAKEYKDLTERARSICKRLKVKAVEVEKVAFVVMRQEDGDMPTDKRSTKTEDISPPPRANDKKTEKATRPAKRKASAGEEDTGTVRPPPERRSKRVQKARHD